MKKCLLVSFIVFAALKLHSQDGSLDNSFGINGKVTTAIGSSSEGRSVAVQSDGKIVVAGGSTNGSDYDFALVRYNTDGSLDTTFSKDGKVTTDFGSELDNGISVAIQSDGKIILAGSSYNIDSDNNFALARYNADGTLDTSFSNDGIITTDFGSGYDYASSVAIQSDGKIVISGSSKKGFNYDFALVRFNSEGSLDSSFGTDGKVTTDFLGNDDLGTSVAIQSDGKIVVSGRSFDGSGYDFALVRYNTDGSLDNLFSVDGKVITDLGSANDYGVSVAIQSDGKIVVVGVRNNGDYDFALVRYNADGSLDSFFNADGIVFTDLGSFDDYGISVTIQSNGKILVTGYSNNGFNYDFALVRYNADGSLDNTFGNDGKVMTDFVSDDDLGTSVVIQSDGKIVVAGLSFNSINKDDFALARYNNASTNIENILASSGSWVIAPNPSNGVFTIQRQGKTNEFHSLEVFNVLGELVYSTASEIIDIADAPNGIYFIKISDGENFYSIKVMKE